MTRRSGLSIFARSFLLMVCALLIASGIGVGVLVLRPPTLPPMASLFDVAAALRNDGAPFSQRDFDDRRPPGSAPRDGQATAMLPGDDRRGPPGMDFMPPNPADLDVRTQADAPTPPDGSDSRLSAHLLPRLAGLLRVAQDDLRVYAVDSGMDRHPGAMRVSMGAGSLVGWRQADGRWRVASVPVEPFPSMLQQELFLLFGVSVLVLLPFAWWFARALSAPIHRFAEAAQRLGADTSAPPVPREGPPEMRRAVDAFNGMQGRVNRLLHERTHMIAAIAHDLRTPLTRLSFRLDGLPGPLGAKVDGDLQEMKTMISAALDFMRDRSLGTQRQPLDFRLLVESVSDDLVDVGHDVAVFSGPPVTLDGDPVALRRAVVNLVENGIKYGQRVRMRLRTVRGECLLEIDDDGPGIPEAMQQQVFAPFFRLESSRNRDTGGIGLGLATVRAIVLDHGGSIVLRNRKEGGLRVVVSLPQP
ncbi:MULTISPECIES: ATP-binding protein [Luteibacter]|uniref:ATP-binding protein n=1 Tax=Luteibacter TaxID=242605 RepID=UPI000568C0DD